MTQDDSFDSPCTASANSPDRREGAGTYFLLTPFKLQ
jgi:hypothetical protein